MSNLSSSRAAQVLPEPLLHSGYSFFCTAAQMVFILLDTVLLKVGSKSIHFLVEVNSILLQRYFNINFNIASTTTSTLLQFSFSDSEVDGKPFLHTPDCFRDV